MVDVFKLLAYLHFLRSSTPSRREDGSRRATSPARRYDIQWLAAVLWEARATLLFVVEQADEQGNIPAWEELKVRWNRRYPEWSSKKREDLHRAYYRVAKILLPTIPLNEY